MPAIPSSTPPSPPSVLSRTDSVRNWVEMCRRVAPSARRSPISERRSSTEITITLAMPTPPTSSATAPRPSSSEVNAPFAAAFASSASEGRETATCSGFSGSAEAGSSERTSPRRLSSART